MLFNEVSDSFARIESISSRLTITQELAALLHKATDTEAAIICTLSLGQLHPPYKGTQFNVAEKSMIKVVARRLGKDEASVAQLAKKLGDIGLVVAQGSWQYQAQLSVEDVYNELCAIEQLEGTGSQEAKIERLDALFASVDPCSAQYIARIVVGSLRLGFSDMTIIDALSWMMVGDKSKRLVCEHAYNMCADIGLIARIAKRDGIEGLEKVTATVGIPIRLAAAERLPTARAIIEKIGHCLAQPKLDGFRLQVHVNKHKESAEVHFFSRNLQDMSYMFPDLTKAFAQLPVSDCICEGEAIVYDPNTGTFLPFQETVKRKRKHGIEDAMQEFPLKLFLFDILYLNGQPLLGESHTQRRAQLLDLLNTVDTKVIQSIEEKEITTAQELEDYFNATVTAGLEGLVVKKPDSIYQPGKRNFNWIKLKRQEEGHLEDTLDCVVLGYYAGSGKRAAFGIGAFLVGIYNEDTDSFETVAKVGTGLKDDEWVALKRRCDENVIAQAPSNVVCAKELVPDVWVFPSIVCLIRADEITLSPVHTAGKTKSSLGYALRFPRFMGYRDDKGPFDATAVSELIRLYKDQFIR